VRAWQKDTPEPHKDSVTSIVAYFVRRREKHERGRQVSEQMFTPVKAAPPTDTERGKEKCKRDHAELKPLTGEKSEPDKGQDGEAQR